MEEREQKEILTKLKASKDNNVMLKSQDGKKYSFTILDLIKNDKRMYAVVKPPIDFPNAKPNKLMIFAVCYNKEDNTPALRRTDDIEAKKKVFAEYNERNRQSA